MKYTLFFLVIFCLSARDAFSQYLSVSQNKISKQNTESKISHNQFIKNLGQWDSRVLFMTKQKGLNAWLTRDGMIYDFYHENISQVNKITDNGRQDISRRSGHVIAMRYGNSGNVTASGTEKKDEYYNYFIGNDPTKWASDVPLFYEVKVENMYPGISYRYYFDGQGLRYDILLSPGADISMINMTYQGAEAVSINDNGDLVLKTSLGDVIQNQLFAYQETDGKRNGVRCSFVVKNDGKIGFDAEWKDRTKPLIIDPLVFSTFVGSSSLDQINDIAVDASGIVITGKTAGVNFPTTTGAYDISQNGNTDAFVAKLNPSGSGLVFSTFIGGSYNDEGDGVSIGTNGIIIMAGSSSSSDYPTTSGVYDHTFNHVSNLWYDCVISKFNANGNILSWSTFLGGSSDSNFSSKVSVDPQGKVTVLGYTYSNDFPVTTGSYDNTFNGSSDIFVTRLNNTGVSLIFSTFVGGSGSDIANKMVQDGSGNIYVCGMTNSSDFPVTLGTFDHTYNNGGDGFVFQLNYLGTSVGFATYIGGSGNDVCNGISLDGNNNIYVTGSTISSDFPVTTGAYSTSITSNLSNDAFVLKMNTSGTSLIYSTYIGGSNEDCGNIITVDASGNAIIAGYTASNDFPTESFSYDNSFNGAEDVFVSKINSSGSGILYSTFIGGVNNDIATGMIISGNSFIIAGNTYSPDYPTTTGAYDNNYNDQNNSSDGFVTKLQFATAIQIGTPTVTNVNCNGDFSGSISINITGGISPYSFVWSNNSHTQNLNGITAGIYSVTVTDMIGNSATASATVTQPPALAISANLTNTSCFVCNNGMIDLTVTGGTSPYSYLWSNMAVTEDLVNITSDTYKVTVTDNKSCVSTGSYTIIVVYQLQVSLSGTDITCFGSNNGSIDLTMINGTSPFSYIWNNNATSDDLTGLAAGTYSVTVTDFLGFTATSAIIINEPVQFSISGIVTNVTCNGCSNGAININITGGTMPYTFLWSNSATTENLAGIPAGNYSVTVSDANSCSYTASYSVFMVFVPSWPYIVTSSNHTILIQSNSSITINGVPAETGDYLGVFYDVSGSLQCGGYIIWNGQTGSIAAWGDDPQTTVKDGFSTGESFKWKIFDSSTGIEYQASATYASGYPNTGTFSANGMSVVSTLNTSATQYINLPSSWCIFSTYIVPQNTNISQVLGAFTSSVIIVKDEIGNVYWPAYGVNNINNMIIGKGYQLKLSSAQTLSVTGTQIIPELTPLNLLSGWGMLGYLRTSQASVATLMNPIVSSINIMKDGDGNVYWPVYGVNLIVNMIPGKGYQIKTSNAVTYTYPAN